MPAANSPRSRKFNKLQDTRLPELAQKPDFYLSPK
jgi:hypothetical protein